MAYPQAYPHDAVEEIAPDLFMVRGRIRMNALMTISRNMAIVRHEGELSLVNPIRLSADGEAQLEALGQVKRILRLGPMHGVDDAYYKDRYAAELWAQAESKSYPEPKIDQRLSSDGALPFPDAQLFEFRQTIQPESVLLVRRDPGVLLTCDAIQHYGDYSNNNWLARRMMPLIGFKQGTVIGPFWLKLMVPQGVSLKPEFEELLGLDFDRLLSAHGSWLASGAKESLRAALRNAYPDG